MLQDTVTSAKETIYTVSQLNSMARALLEDALPLIWVEGEISNFAAPQSGHWYFSLKDASAQVRCAMFRGSQRKLAFTPRDGMHILIRARTSLYEARGEYQLIAEDMEERGEGKLRRAFEALKKKLAAAGLFDPAYKKQIPEFPTRIGVVTSATGAAIQDILNILNRRYPCASIVIYPTLVQGATAAPDIVKAIELANSRKECDVLLLARGGGSLEDLWPFNEEIVAHAIYHSALPIITGIGHEVDFTIADFVADVRAPTPSAAAELAVPDSLELRQQIKKQEQYLLRRMTQKITEYKQQIHWTTKHLLQQHPKRRLAEQVQSVDRLEMTLTHLINARIGQLQNQLAQAATKLDALSPLATLKRGYAIATDNSGNILQNSNAIQIGESLRIRLLIGSLSCTVINQHN